MPMSDDKVYEQMMNDILAIYSQAENEMLEKVAKRVAKGITTEGWNESKLHDTQKLNKELLALVHQVNKRAKVKILKGAKVQFYAGSKEDFDKMEVPLHLKQLLKATYGLIDDASSKVLRNANDAYQQIMAHGTTGLLAGTDTRIQATQKMLNEYVSKGITTFIDKAGRNWSLSSYAEMCARTVSSHAAIQGQIERQLSVGEDLVKVSEIGTTCPICMRWQGVVLSISGNHPKYHSLDTARAAGLFHSNCKHTITMFVPELDGEGKVEPSDVDTNSEAFKRNKLIEKQRSYERNIRYWKNREAVAITDSEKLKAHSKVKYWQYKNMLHCEKNGLRRQYARECNLKGDANGKMGTFIGGTVKEFENLYKDVIGEDAKKVHKTLLKMDFQMSEKQDYQKWLRDEIMDLDQLDLDKAMMKDSKNKSVTPTSLYKKYIGDSPMQDYTVVSEFEKGTKEYKSGYAKWLKQQIEEIGVTYKVKPQYKEVSQYKEVNESIPDEDKKLSATELYKKYHNGKKPTEAYKEAGGEEGTGMKYGKWVETQKKELIKNGITKKVPFENSSVQKNKEIIVQATKTIKEAKEKLEKMSTKTATKEKQSGTSIESIRERYKDLPNSVLNDFQKKVQSGNEKAIENMIGRLEKVLSTNRDNDVAKKSLELWKEARDYVSKNKTSQQDDKKDKEVVVGSKEWNKKVTSIHKKVAKPSSNYTKAVDDSIIEKLSKSSQNYQKAYLKAISKVKKVANEQEGSYYSKIRKCVNIDFDLLKRQSESYDGSFSDVHTWFHEIGHAIDDVHGLPSQKKSFLQAIEKDKEKLLTSDGKLTESVKETIREMKSGSRGLQDTLSGIGTKDYVQWRHDEDYWARGDRKKETASELFAHLSAAMVDERQYVMMKKHFPNALAEFEKAISDNEVKK